MKEVLFGVVIATSFISPAFADGSLTPIEVPPSRPYPYQLQGMQPGMPLEEVMTRFAELSDSKPTSSSKSMRVQSSTGGAFEFEFETSRTIGDIGMYARMANEPQDSTSVTLSTEVLEQRPLQISRSIRKPAEEMPELLELKAQIEELYGPASIEKIDSYSMELTYAWGEDGFIPDLEGMEPTQMEVEGGNFPQTVMNFKPCATYIHAVDTRVEYRFEYPRTQPLMPGCVAIYQVTYEAKPGDRVIRFSLTDYELGRLHRDELDRQIVEKISNQSAEPSDLDL